MSAPVLSRWAARTMVARMFPEPPTMRLSYRDGRKAQVASWRSKSPVWWVVGMCVGCARLARRHRPRIPSRTAPTPPAARTTRHRPAVHRHDPAHPMTDQRGTYALIRVPAQEIRVGDRIGTGRFQGVQVVRVRFPVLERMAIGGVDPEVVRISLGSHGWLGYRKDERVLVERAPEPSSSGEYPQAGDT